MENELLKNEPTASVKAMLDYSEKMFDSLLENEVRTVNERPAYEQAFEYWSVVSFTLSQEMELRIKKIFI